ncbi:sigma-70 family RNA polymerase sigma factor [Gelidibacter sp.]|uniref:RNA polymerase sigma factor n=1 Tax=Gelidibacter sp. TaxID=2018083 RepID=UPI002C26A172|nr:sigma-70 family RNA polymerase sigma factor [Gelidibacter sp.]HUH26958.1 sigma-70 family RNA polymerase sigma factor [Gelidibacter sp.]
MTFKEIYNHYWPKIFRLCMGYVNDHALAQDLAQDTFIIVWEQLPKFRNESSIGTWIYRIASNRCLRQLETNKRIQTSELPFQIKQETPASIEPEIQFLYACVSELPETDRIIISLELEDIKQSEIAKIVGLSEGNIRVKIHRIKAILTQKFKVYER